jgi:hypothetical protein
MMTLALHVPLIGAIGTSVIEAFACPAPSYQLRPVASSRVRKSATGRPPLAR